MQFLMVCLVGLLVSVQASPLSPPMVSGHVRLPDGSPVAGAQVVLFDVADLRRGPVGQATTTRRGSLHCRWRRVGLSCCRQKLRWGKTIPIRSIPRR